MISQVKLYQVLGHRGFEGSTKADELEKERAATFSIAAEPISGITLAQTEARTKEL